MRRAPIRLRSGVVGVRLSLKRPARKKLSLACGAKTINFQKYGLGLIFEGFASLELQRPLAAVAIRLRLYLVHLVALLHIGCSSSNLCEDRCPCKVRELRQA